MSPMSLIRRFARFVRQGYPQHAPAVGHCLLLALARTPGLDHQCRPCEGWGA
ncbi:DUF1804 family protein [Mycobacteroides abscessus]|uniref:DUF1804 family protein n=1 Tax=Mycobacteroides abscessus TaxID=36809 RepID=UPI001C65D557